MQSWGKREGREAVIQWIHGFKERKEKRKRRDEAEWKFRDRIERKVGEKGGWKGELEKRERMGWKVGEG